MPAFAQGPAAVGLDTVVVTATRTPLAQSAVLADVSVLQRADIVRSGATNVADLLARLPGIEFARNGGAGTNTSVYIRGSESRHTAVYVDGLRVDSQSTGGAAWEQIPLVLIDRIEVLRGPAAAVYGSDAVAGVVQLFTRRGQGDARPEAALTVGSRRSLQAEAGVSGASGVWDYAVSIASARSDGQDARTAAAPGHNPDADGWQRHAAQARVGLQLTDRQRVEATLLASRLRSDYDSSPTADDENRHTLGGVGLSWQARWDDDASTRVHLGESRNTYEAQPSYYRTETTLRDLLLQHEQRWGVQTVTAALERRGDELFNPATQFSNAVSGKRHQDGLALGWRADLGPHTLQAHARHDADSEFGGKRTGSLAWGWRFAPQWRATAAAATSFRVPTLYQRFSQYGNPSLVPESGRNVELGLRWATAAHEAGITVWRNRVSQLIGFGDPGPCADDFGCYENVGQARLKGVTLAGRTTLAGVALHASYDWRDPRNADTGRLLARRAQRLATLGADTTWGRWNAGLEWQAAGRRYDDAANARPLGGYGLVNLLLGTALAPGLALQARVDNVGDKAYESARTYASEGRSVQVALRWSMP